MDPPGHATAVERVLRTRGRGRIEIAAGECPEARNLVVPRDRNHVLLRDHRGLLDIATPNDHAGRRLPRSEEHTSELQSRPHLVCRLLLVENKSRGPPTLPARPLHA